VVGGGGGVLMHPGLGMLHRTVRTLKGADRIKTGITSTDKNISSKTVNANQIAAPIKSFQPILVIVVHQRNSILEDGEFSYFICLLLEAIFDAFLFTASYRGSSDVRFSEFYH
jgi:hypothetical protein